VLFNSLQKLWTVVASTAAVLLTGASIAQAADPAKIRLDYAYYNPVSLVLKDQGWVEQEFAKSGIAVEWVLSQGSNKALEFLNARSIDFGSTAGAAALLAKINGNPIKSIYVYSRPEWTALVTRADSPIKTVADLKGKRIAVTRGTDPHIFLIRALANAGLSERDVKAVLLQHPDGKTALEKGDVDAWAGLDPFMAQTELESGSRLFFRNAELNTYGVLNVREDFAKQNPLLVQRLLQVYEQGRQYALKNPAELRATLAKAAKLDEKVAARQLERTEFSNSKIGDEHRKALTEAGKALQASGVIPAEVNVVTTVEALIDSQFSNQLASK
jgi:sulfonate transport system substrate-binding protein